MICTDGPLQKQQYIHRLKHDIVLEHNQLASL